MSSEHQDLTALTGSRRAVYQTVRLAYPLSLGALVLAIAMSWLCLVVMGVRTAVVDPRAAGPGSVWLQQFPDTALPASFEALLALCLAPVGAGSNLSAFILLAFMWFLMALAMMLPSSGPLLRTYCEIADTAVRKGERVVHPAVLVAGYLSAWFSASLGFAGASLVFSRMLPGDMLFSPWTGPAGAAVLAIAGLYQFSGLKEACLVKCRNPFATLFGRWSTRPISVYRLGIEQGAWCLGCCWALMFVMFAVGIMNVFWMALLGVFTMVEKTGHSRVFTRISGALLLVWAFALLVISF
ncbi:DUF2182 domain-containing protein [Nitratireductor kimnyeongensis]|uniref:DUF2182 domain-containing protein n=1 Tax=Nitratireductor kimnyeongensis TaxID=430679 RepID=A0ABW0TBW2_9HYPH|nr:DUF2182 domain-containing protein [Nitratireductor kimnyeongensis]